MDQSPHNACMMPVLALVLLDTSIDRLDFKANFSFSYNNKISQLLLISRSLLLTPFLIFVVFSSSYHTEVFNTNGILAFENLS